MTSLPTPAAPRRRRSAVTRYALAGAALLGVGAAATTALWTDDAWFSAEASAIDPATAIDLRGAFVETGSPAPGDFITADDDPASGTDVVRIPAHVLAGLTAGDSVTVPVWLRNAGTADLAIAEPTVRADGPLFAPGGATATLGTAPTALAVGGTASVDLTVALPAQADAGTFGGAAGSVAIAFQGSLAPRS